VTPGRDLLTGLPRSVEAGADQIREAIEVSVAQIVGAIKDTIEETPELVADIMDQGIVSPVGGPPRGPDRRVAEATQMPVHVADDPLTCVARGTAVVLQLATRPWSECSSPRPTAGRRADRRSPGACVMTSILANRQTRRRGHVRDPHRSRCSMASRRTRTSSRRSARRPRCGRSSAIADIVDNARAS
jgi:hypothetical protein